MSGAERHIVVTGAGGFIGGRLAQALIARPDFADAVITLNDRMLAGAPNGARIRHVEGDFGHAEVRQAMLSPRADIVFHLAGVLGGAAEADYAGSRRVNIDATLDLFEALRRPGAPPRLVYASSVAVFGPPFPAVIDDDTLPLPGMTYGAQKRMMEVAVEQFAARGCVDGVALRLPGIVARPGADARLKSAFLNNLFFAIAAGHDITLPVSPSGTTWLISIEACVTALVHAAAISAPRLGRRRAFTLPALCLSFGELVAALKVSYPASRSVVDYEPNPEIEAQFGSQPPLATALADELGFEHDGNAATLVTRALARSDAAGLVTGEHGVANGATTISGGN